MYRFLLVTMFASVLGQLELSGDCNLADASPVMDLNITRLLGTWNQIKRIGNVYEVGECGTMTISEHTTDQQYVIRVSLVERVNSTTKVERVGVITSIATGVYEFDFGNELYLPFVIQATDYTGYAVLYACYSNENGGKSVMAWQYDRKAILTQEEQTRVDQVITANADLQNITWKVTNQDNSFCNSAVSLSVTNVFYFALMVAASYVFKLNIHY